MSPLFNSSALNGLSTATLAHLRAALAAMLAYDRQLTEADHRQLHAALLAVETALYASAAAKAQAPRPCP